MMKRKILSLSALLFLLAGLAVLAYPAVQGAAAVHEMKQQTRSFLQEAAVPEQTVPDLSRPQKPAKKYQELWTAMNDYNREIFREKQADLRDPWSYEQPSFTLADFGLEDEVFGVLTIPRLELEMPVYLGATWAHMADGAAHLSQTSLPIGGPNTNCVIAGHRGWGGAPYFRYLTDLEPGDKAEIRNLWETLHYEVSEIRIIAPDEVEAIHIRPGQELLTLLTCHPYASGGRQRYLVICERRDH